MKVLRSKLYEKKLQEQNAKLLRNGEVRLVPVTAQSASVRTTFHRVV